MINYTSYISLRFIFVDFVNQQWLAILTPENISNIHMCNTQLNI